MLQADEGVEKAAAPWVASLSCVNPFLFSEASAGGLGAAVLFLVIFPRGNLTDPW